MLLFKKKSPLFNELEPPRKNDRVDAIPMFYWKVKDLSGDLQMFHPGPTMPTGGHIMANKHGSCTRKIPQKYYHLVMTNIAMENHHF